MPWMSGEVATRTTQPKISSVEVRSEQDVGPSQPEEDDHDA